MKEEIKKALRFCNLKFREYNDYFQLSCPYASMYHADGDDKKYSLSIYKKKGEWRFFCFTCKQKGEIWRLFDWLGNVRKNKDILQIGEDLFKKNRLSIKESILQEWFKRPKPKPFSIKGMKLSQKCLDYLENRGIQKEIIYKYNMVSLNENTMLFPIWHNNKWIGGIARTIDKKIWVVNGISISRYLGGFQFDSGQFIVLVEGFLDIMYLAPIVWELEGDVYSVNTSQASYFQMEKLKEKKKPVFIMFDNDLAGKKGTLKTLNLAGGIKIKKVQYEANDIKLLDKKILKNILTRELDCL